MNYTEIEILRNIVQEELNVSTRSAVVDKVTDSYVNARVGHATILKRLSVIGDINHLQAGSTVLVLSVAGTNYALSSGIFSGSTNLPAGSSSASLGSTYYDKTEINDLLSRKADAGHSHRYDHLEAVTGTLGGFEVGPDYIRSAIGNFAITSNVNATRMVMGSGTDVAVMDGKHATYRFWAGDDVPADAPFSVEKDGKIHASAGDIAGWDILTNKLSKNNVELDPAGQIKVGTDEDVAVMGTTQGNWRLWIGSATPGLAPFRVDKDGNAWLDSATIALTLESDNFETGVQGWKLWNTGEAEFQDVTVRGRIEASVFAKTTMSGVSGQMTISIGDNLLNDCEATSTTIDVLTDAFTVSDIIQLKPDASRNEWMRITAGPTAITGGYQYTVERSYDGSGPFTFEAGTAAMRKGNAGDIRAPEGLAAGDIAGAFGAMQPGGGGGESAGGWIILDGEASSLSVITREGPVWNQFATQVRLGNLSGVLDYSSETYGLFIGDDNDYLAYDETNGLRMQFLGAGYDVKITSAGLEAELLILDQITAPGAGPSGSGHLYAKTGDDGLFWHPYGGSEVDLTTGGGGGAPTDAEYLVLTLDGTLTDERVLVGTANQITLTDGGAGGNATLSLPSLMIWDSAAVTLRTTTSGNITLDAFGDIHLQAGGDDVFVTPSTGAIADLFLNSDQTSGTFARLNFRAHNTTPADKDYFYLAGNIVSATPGSESGLLYFYALDNGTLALSQAHQGGNTTASSVQYRSNLNTATDVIGSLIFRGRNSVPSSHEYALIQAVIEDPTSTQEDGELRFRTYIGGASTERIRLDSAAIKFYDDLQFQQASELGTSTGLLTVDAAGGVAVLTANDVVQLKVTGFTSQTSDIVQFLNYNGIAQFLWNNNGKLSLRSRLAGGETFEFKRYTSNTDVVRNVGWFEHETSGTIAQGFGTSISLVWQEGTGPTRYGAEIGVSRGVDAQDQDLWAQSVYGADYFFYAKRVSGEPNFGVGTNSPSATFHGVVNLGGATSVRDALKIARNCTVAVGDGVGVGAVFQAETSTTTGVDVGYIEARWADSTHATYKGRIDIDIYDSGTGVRGFGGSDGHKGVAIVSDGSEALVGIGIPWGTTPDGKLHVYAGSAGAVSAEASGDDLVVENSGDGGFSVLTPDANYGGVYFGSPSNNKGAWFSYKYNTTLSFEVAAAPSLGFNTLLNDVDIQFGSDNLDDMIYTNAGDDKVIFAGKSISKGTGFQVGAQTQTGGHAKVNDMIGFSMGNVETSDTAANWGYLDYTDGGFHAIFNMMSTGLYFDKATGAWVDENSAYYGAYYTQQIGTTASESGHYFYYAEKATTGLSHLMSMIEGVGIVINDDGNTNQDIRAESDDEPYFLFLDSSANKFMIGQQTVDNGAVLAITDDDWNVENHANVTEFTDVAIGGLGTSFGTMNLLGQVRTSNTGYSNISTNYYYNRNTDAWVARDAAYWSTIYQQRVTGTTGEHGFYLYNKSALWSYLQIGGDASTPWVYINKDKQDIDVIINGDNDNNLFRTVASIDAISMGGVLTANADGTTTRLYVYSDGSAPAYPLGTGTDGASNIFVQHSAGSSGSLGAGFLARYTRGSIASPSQTLSGDRLGFFLFGGIDNQGTPAWGNQAGFLSYANENYTSTGKGTRLELVATAVGSTSRAVVATLLAGIDVGGATGGDKGSGTINVATDIYKNNSAYTNPDYVLEEYYRGEIEIYKDSEGASEYGGLQPIDVTAEFMEANLHLPWIGRDSSGVFDRGDMLLVGQETMMLHIIGLNKEIKKLNRELKKLRKIGDRVSAIEERLGGL